MKSKRWWMVSAVLAVLGMLFAFGAFTPEVFASGHGAEGGGNPLNPLESIRADLALWTAVTFLVVLAILWKYAWGPIVSGLDKREAYVQAQRTDAEKASEDAKALLAEYKTQLATAKAEIQQMQADARVNAERAANLLMDRAKADILSEQRTAMQEIANAKIQAQKELAANGAELAVLLAGTILKRELDPKAHATLIRDVVSRFEK